jgi:hypothetical protein
MPRIRTIKPEFWADEKIGTLQIPCRLFYIGCWNFADDFGVIRGNAVILKSQIFPYDEDLRVSEIKKWIDALVDARMLVPIIRSGESYYVIRTFHSHQVLDKRYHKSYLSDNIKETEQLIAKALQGHTADTASPHSGHEVITSEEKEEEKEYKESIPKGIPKKGELSLTPACSDSPKDDYIKFREWMKDNAPFCDNEAHFKSSHITEEELTKLKRKYTGQQIADTILQIENRTDLRKRYSNLYLTVNNWLKPKENGR